MRAHWGAWKVLVAVGAICCGVVVACGSDGEDLSGSSSPAGSGGGTAGSSGQAGTGGGAGTAGIGGVAGSAGTAGSGGGTAGSSGQAGSGGGTAGSAGTAGTGGTSGAAGAAGTGGGGPECAIQTGLSACDQCINTSCFAECDKCANNPECLAIWTCIRANCVTDGGPPSTACATQCVTQHYSGLKDFGDFWQAMQPGCVAKNCAGSCPTG